jgi:hypothetical protein
VVLNDRCNELAFDVFFERLVKQPSKVDKTTQIIFLKLVTKVYYSSYNSGSINSCLVSGFGLDVDKTTHQGLEFISSSSVLH